jgi:hypothetical protein
MTELLTLKEYQHRLDQAVQARLFVEMLEKLQKHLKRKNSFIYREVGMRNYEKISSKEFDIDDVTGFHLNGFYAADGYRYFTKVDKRYVI